jgi:hypothetical protein
MRFITLVLSSAVCITAFSLMATSAATPEKVVPNIVAY